MDAASMPPEQEEMGARNNRHIPPEIVVEILLNLPVKSLLRFSCVSKSWSSMISESGFIKRHQSRATLPGRERMVIKPCYYPNTAESASTCPLFSISDQPIEDATKLICPFQGKPSYKGDLHAFCDGLWCVQVEKSLFLWNPSMRTYRKLPDPSFPPWPVTVMYQFVYGLGYDSVGDDYKILKLSTVNYPTEAELYSLRSDSWRKIDQPSPENFVLRSKGEFVSGALHWMVDPVMIISFDLSTEKYGEVAQPEYSPTLSPEDNVEVIVLRGMLCVCLNYYRDTKVVLWVMKDYGVAKSWTKMFDIQHCNSIRFFQEKLGTPLLITLIPLYFYDNGEILIKVFSDWDKSMIFMYKDEKTIPQMITVRGSCSKFFDCFLYVESLISPAIWPTASPVVGNNKA